MMLVLVQSVVSLLAIGLCGLFLHAHARGGSVPGCGAGSGCETLAASRWAKIGPVPVAALGLVVYVPILLAVVLRHLVIIPPSLATPSVHVAVGILLAGFLWFSFLQLVVIGRVCWLCMSYHSLGVSFSFLEYARSGIEWLPVLAGAALMGLAALLQALIRPRQYHVSDVREIDARTDRQSEDPPPSTGSALPATDRAVILAAGRVALAEGDWPLIGNPDAKRVLALLFDVTCDTCRQTYRTVCGAVSADPEGLAVLAIPVPQNSACNPTILRDEPPQEHACELAELIHAAWLCDREAAWTLLWWMTEPTRPPPLSEARSRAHRTLGGQLSMALMNPLIRQRIQTAVSFPPILHESAKLPQLVLETRVIWGKLATTRELLAAINP